MWCVSRIAEADYGCEERMPGEPLMVLVTLESDDGRECQFEVSEDWLCSQGIEEGDEWPEDIDEVDEDTQNELLNKLQEIKSDLDSFLKQNLEATPRSYSMPMMPRTQVKQKTVKIPAFLKQRSAGPCAYNARTEEVEAIYSSEKTDLDKALEQKSETFSTMLLRLIDEKGLKDSDVYKKANIDRRLFSKIRGDEDYVPSKKTAIAFCFALQLKIEEARQLLETAGYALSSASRFDLIIVYLIENGEYNIQFVNLVLDEYGEGTLSK